MKKSLFLIIYLSILCFNVNYAQAQNLKFDGLIGNKITSVIENISTPVIIGGESGAGGNQPAVSGPAKTEKAIWETTLEHTSASKKLKRIIFSVPGPDGLEKYDSDNSFESTDGAENWVKKFIQVLGKPSIRKLETGSVNSKPSAAGNNTDNVWNSDIPLYDPSLYWNGLIIQFPTSLKMEKNTNWKTEFTVNSETVQNEFTIIEAYKDNLKIKVKSKVIFNSADKASLNADGAPAGISLGVQKKQRTFDGFVSVDSKTMLVLSGNFQIETVSVLNINGSGSERKAYSTTTISNSISK